MHIPKRRKIGVRRDYGRPPHSQSSPQAAIKKNATIAAIPIAIGMVANAWTRIKIHWSKTEGE